MASNFSKDHLRLNRSVRITENDAKRATPVPLKIVAGKVLEGCKLINGRIFPIYPINREIEFRTPIHDINRFNNHDVIGSQGMIVSYYKDSKFCSFGSGNACILNYKIGNSKRSKQLVLTCAHNFIAERKKFSEYLRKADELDSEYYFEKSLEELAEAGSFFYRRTRTANNTYTTESINKIDDLFIYPDYYDDLSSFNDLAIGFLEHDTYNFGQQKDISLGNVEIAKVGDVIMIVGYPGEYEGQLSYQNGNIHSIEYSDNRHEAIITFKNITLTCGNSGSSVYLKKNDGSWVVIGVAVATCWEQKVEVAMGLTTTKLKWIEGKIKSSFA